MENLQQEIIKQFNLENIPEEKKEEMINTIGKILFQAVLMRSMNNLSELDQNELEKIIDENSEPEKVFGFLQKRVEGFENIIKEEMEKLKSESMEVMSQII